MLHPTTDSVIEDLARLNQHGLESRDAPVPVLGSLKDIRRWHGCDFNAELAKDAIALYI